MRGKEPRPRPHSNVRYELTVYRNEHNPTQEQLAELLEVEPRTLRRWENGETILSDVYELRRIADCLGIPHEHLGIAVPILLSPEELSEGVSHVWDLIQTGFIKESRTVAVTMVMRGQQSSPARGNKLLRLHT